MHVNLPMNNSRCFPLRPRQDDIDKVLEQEKNIYQYVGNSKNLKDSHSVLTFAEGTTVIFLKL